MDSSGLVALLHRLNDPQVSVQSPQLHQLRQFHQKSDCVEICLQILTEDHPEFVLVSTIGVLELCIKRSSLINPNPSLTNNILNFLWAVVPKADGSAVANKLCHLLLLAAKYDPSGCSQLVIARILEMLANHKTAFIGSRLLLSLSEEFVEPRGVLESRRLQLEATVRNSLPQLLFSAFSLLDAIFCLRTGEAAVVTTCPSLSMAGNTIPVTCCNLLKFLNKIIPISTGESLNTAFFTILLRHGDSLKFNPHVTNLALGAILIILRDQLVFVGNDDATAEIIGQTMTLVERRVLTDSADERLVELLRIFSDNLISKFGHDLTNRWIRVLTFLTFRKEAHLLDCLHIWDKYFDSVLHQKTWLGNSELPNCICELVSHFANQLASFKAEDDCGDEFGFINSSLSAINKAVLLFPSEILPLLLDRSRRAYSALQSSDSPSPEFLDEISASIRITSSLVPLFESSFDHYFPTAEKFFLGVIKLSYPLFDRHPERMTDVFEFCQMLSTWVSHFLSTRGWDEAGNFILGVLSLGLRPFLQSRLNSVLHSAAAMLRTFMLTVRPPLTDSPQSQLYSQLIESLLGPTTLPEPIRTELFISYSNVLILPWSCGQQNWSARKEQHYKFIRKMYLVLDISTFMDCSTQLIRVLQSHGSAKSREICLSSFSEFVEQSVLLLNSQSLLSGQLCQHYFQFLTAAMLTFRVNVSIKIIQHIFAVFCDCFASISATDSPFCRYFIACPLLFDCLLSSLSVALKHSNKCLFPVIDDILRILSDDGFFALTRAISPISGVRAIFEIAEALLTFHLDLFSKADIPLANLCVLLIKVCDAALTDLDIELCQRFLQFFKSMISNKGIFGVAKLRSALFAPFGEKCLFLLRSPSHALVREDALSLLFEVAASDWATFNTCLLSGYLCRVRSEFVSSLGCDPLDVTWDCPTEFTRFKQTISSLFSDVRLYDELV